MQMEHVAYPVDDPAAVAAWYCRHLGFRVKRKLDAAPFTHFLADDSGMMLEIYNNPRVAVPDYAAMDPLLLHVAFSSDDVTGERDRLVAAGATVADDVLTTPAGDEMVMLRDPWGLAIQFITRRDPMR